MSTLSRTGAKPVALDEHILSLSDGIIGTVAFNNIYGSNKFTQNKNFQHVLDEVAEVLSSFSAEEFFPKAIGRLIDRVTGIVAQCERIFKQLDAFFDIVIEQHLDPDCAKPKNGGDDLTDMLISHWKEHRGTLRFTKDHVKAIISDTFIAGIVTSSIRIMWAMSEVIRSPRVLNKVQAEIRAVVGGNGRVRSEDVSELKYVKILVKETSWLHPPAPLRVPRETMRHIQIRGYDVPAKTMIYVNTWAIGRDQASWDDHPQEFNPEMFEVNEIEFKGEHPQLLPFGTGRLICPGMWMGIATVEFTLANMLCSFQWALPKGMVAEDVSMGEEGKFNFHRKTPLVLVPIAC